MSAAAELAWQDCLDRFAGCLAEQRSALAEDRLEDFRAFVPEPLGALPTSLEPRARALCAQASALEAELASALADVGRQLRLVTTMAQSSSGSLRPTASLLDDRG